MAAALLGFAHAPLAASANHIVLRSTAPQAVRSNPRSHAALAAGTMPLVYVCDYADSVLVYDATLGETTQFIGAPVETITGLHGPTSLAVDAADNLYVVEAAAYDVIILARTRSNRSRRLPA